VVPEVVQVFAGMNQQLPWLTRALIATSDTVREWGWLMLLGLIALITGVRQILKRPAARLRWDGMLLKLPLIGRLVRGLNTARFARTLNILAGSGVPLLDALNMSASVISNTPMREAVAEAARRVREGSGVGHALERSGYFPPMTLSLIKSGESSGTLDKMLERAAETQERELEARIAMVMGVFEPLLILAMGGVVLIIVLAILLPIFELNQLVNRYAKRKDSLLSPTWFHPDRGHGGGGHPRHPRRRGGAPGHGQTRPGPDHQGAERYPRHGGCAAPVTTGHLPLPHHRAGPAGTGRASQRRCCAQLAGRWLYRPPAA